MGHVVWTMEEAVRALPAQDIFWLSNCSCREEKGSVCGKGMRVCLGFSESATSTSNGRGPISRKEMYELLKFAKAEKLVPRPYLDDQGTMTALCLCCPCCCDYTLGKPGAENIAGPSIEATAMELCTSCGSCADVCYFGARQIGGDGLLKIDRSKCFGCGLCADACAPGAVKMGKR